jgi:alpha-L-rhamnosidase
MSEIRMAARFGKGKEKYLWNVNPFQYGDWCAPGEGVGAWKKKGKFLATCFLANSVSIMHKAAGELGKIKICIL